MKRNCGLANIIYMCVCVCVCVCVGLMFFPRTQGVWFKLSEDFGFFQGVKEPLASRQGL